MGGYVYTAATLTRWAERFDQMVAPEGTKFSAKWCPRCSWHASEDENGEKEGSLTINPLTGNWCNNCKKCHDCGMTWNFLVQTGRVKVDSVVGSAGLMPMFAFGVMGVPEGIAPVPQPSEIEHDAVPRSQKAKGITLLSTFVQNPILGTASALAWAKPLIQDEITLKKACGMLKFTSYFARPCPLRPRHGFVESRIVSTPEELTKMWEEVKAVEPEGEIILTHSYGDAVHTNAILTPTLITIGPGNDGATAGKNTISIPIVQGKKYQLLDPSLAVMMGVTDTPYVEMIWGTSKTPIITQVRSGPSLGSVSPDYIPKAITIKEIIQPNGEDLIAWEKRIESLKGSDGFVVYHPGGSMIDHYAVHARANEIPLITTFKPAVGDQLVPTSSSPWDPVAFNLGVVAAERSPIKTDPHAGVVALLLGLHHSAAMTGKYTFWVGYACAMMARLGTTAATGEARHVLDQFGNKKYFNGSSRDAVYAKCYKWSLSRMRAKLSQVINVHRYGRFSGSMGGMKWAQCAVSLIPIFDAIKANMASPSETNVKAALAALNVSVNQAHHNGWWLNKFTSGGMAMFNELGAGCLAHILPLIPTFYEWTSAGVKIEEVEEFARKAAKWDEGVPKPPMITSSKFVYVPGNNHAEVHLGSRALKKWGKVVHVPLNIIGDRVLKVLEGRVMLDDSDANYRLLLNTDEKPVVLWEDEPLTPQEIAK